jgi:hypothetical protein
MCVFLDTENLRIEKLEVNGYKGTKEDRIILENKENITVNVILNAVNTVPSCQLRIVVFVKDVAPVFTKELSLCAELLAQNQETCPITPGSHTYKATSNIGNEAIHGDYRVRISVFEDSLTKKVLLYRDIYLSIK